VEIVDFVDEGLGHSSYLVDLGDGRALVVDPPRLPLAHLDAARARGLTIAYTADTHSHADYVSGSPELASRGATFLASKGAGLEVPHRDVDAGEDVRLNDHLGLRAIPTPGHTPEHLAYLLCEDGEPVALFSGGSLMVGTVGRTDLLGPEPRESLARRLYHALRDEILTLPDDLAVYPTHGAGSFCSAPGASERTTTIGRERQTNPLLQAPDEDAFVAQLLDGFGTFPTYFSRLPEVNRRGPRLYGELPELDHLSVADVERLLTRGALIIDARPIAAFAAGHIPGALSIELRPVFASWLGWLADPEQPLIFVLDDDQDRHDLVRQCLDVGYEHLAGELDGGMTAWRVAELPDAHTDIVDAVHLSGRVIDVRQRAEYAAGHVPDALNIELGALPTASLPDGPLTIMCGHGERAMTAASVIERRGRRDLGVLAGGPNDWTNATGEPLETSA
jgi:glyoxylase-like metal-dependent hydrolase (beta-lactamase superfamily II)/rhodanese-related sulfurtransferase